LESVSEIMSERGIDDLRIVFGLQLSFIDANQLLSFAGLLAETVVSDPIQPGRKSSFAAEAAEILVRPQKGFLRQIVRERNIGPDQLPKQTSDARLMISHQLCKSMVVVIDKNTSDEVCIG